MPLDSGSRLARAPTRAVSVGCTTTSGILQHTSHHAVGTVRHTGQSNLRGGTTPHVPTHGSPDQTAHLGRTFLRVNPAATLACRTGCQKSHWHPQTPGIPTGLKQAATKQCFTCLATMHGKAQVHAAPCKPIGLNTHAHTPHCNPSVTGGFTFGNLVTWGRHSHCVVHQKKG